MIVSVPEVQPANVQPDRSSEPPVVMLRTSACVEAVPVINAVFEILPAPNWADPKVAVDVPEVLTKATPSMLTKPSMPLVAAAVRLMLVPAPATPICSVSLSAPPS